MKQRYFIFNRKILFFAIAIIGSLVNLYLVQYVYIGNRSSSALDDEFEFIKPKAQNSYFSLSNKTDENDLVPSAERTGNGNNIQNDGPLMVNNIQQNKFNIQQVLPEEKVKLDGNANLIPKEIRKDAKPRELLSKRVNDEPKFNVLFFHPNQGNFLLSDSSSYDGRFSNNITMNIRRGINIISHLSGMDICSKIYVGKMGKREKAVGMIDDKPQQKLLRKENLKDLKANETIFVHGFWLKEFTKQFLPLIKVPFVLFSARYKIQPAYPQDWGPLGTKIVENPNLIRWFMLDIGNYTGGQGDHDKVRPFPLGLKPKMGKAGTFRDPVPIMRNILRESMTPDGSFKVEKTEDIFVGYLQVTNPSRSHIPRSKKPLPYDQYLLEIAKSKYVLSPDGLFPECHRHYESLALGAIPITELKPNKYYHHLKDGPIIYDNHEWNLTALRATLPSNAYKRVNRNMIFEEYWMEYVERDVGQPLLWWDVVGKRESRMEEFQFVDSVR